MEPFNILVRSVAMFLACPSVRMYVIGIPAWFTTSSTADVGPARRTNTCIGCFMLTHLVRSLLNLRLRLLRRSLERAARQSSSRVG